MLMADLIAGICTAVVVGVLLWTFITEHRKGDYSSGNNSLSDKNSKGKEKEDINE